MFNIHTQWVRTVVGRGGASSVAEESHRLTTPMHRQENVSISTELVERVSHGTVWAATAATAIDLPFASVGGGLLVC